MPTVAAIRRRNHNAELRNIILDAAREVFIREGYESVSMRKLAQLIGYSPAAIYLHFRGKEELLTCLVEESFATLLLTLQRIRDNGDPVLSLKKKLRAYVEFGLRCPNHYRFAFIVRPRARPRGVIKPHAAFDVLRHAVRRCRTEDRFKPVDVETASQALWAAVHGVTSLLIVLPAFPWVRRERLIRNVINSAVGSLTAGDQENRALAPVGRICRG